MAKELLKAHGKPPREVYLDLENSGWVPPEVVEAMIPYFNRIGYGHPSITNKPGWEAYEVVYETRERVAETLGIKEIDGVVFTHSGTEANNLAVMGVGLAKRKNRGKIVVSSIEHLSVIFPAERLEKLFGFKVVQIPVSKEGFVEPELFQLYVDRDTVLVSIQLVNHEIGCIQPLKELVDIARSANPDVIFHTDAVDAYGRLRLDVERLGVDLVTLSSHKILGPKGIGVLYVRPGVELESVILGQLSTQKMWPGVENVPAIAGFKKAIELAFENFDENVSKMRRLRDRLMKGIQERVSDVLINGPLGEKRVVDNANMSFLYVEGEALTVELSLRGVYVSSGSACTSRHLEPSHVLLAIGRKYEEAHGSILFKVTRYHCDDDIDYVISQVPQAVERLRKLSAIKSKKNK